MWRNVSIVKRRDGAQEGMCKYVGIGTEVNRRLNTGCCNKISGTEGLNKKFIPHSTEGQVIQDQGTVLTSLVSGENPFPGPSCCILTY